MTNRIKRPYVFDEWGNSILFRNVKFWTCSYCGLLIPDETPFEIALINGNPIPFIFDKEICVKLQVMKLEAQHVDRPSHRSDPS